MVPTLDENSKFLYTCIFRHRALLLWFVFLHMNSNNIMKIKYSKVIYKTEDSLASAWSKSIGIDVKDCPKHPTEDLDPRKHLMD